MPRVGASKLALIGAVVGIFAGLFFGAVGLLAGPLVGALGGELIHGREVGQATRVGFGMTGILLGTALKIGLAFGMLGLFAFAREECMVLQRKQAGWGIGTYYRRQEILTYPNLSLLSDE